MLYQELRDIKKIVETSSQDEVNKFLSEGWRLIDTYKSTYSSENDDELVMYVLGRGQE